MQRALDAGTVVIAELADVVGDVVEVGGRHRPVAEQHLAAGHARFRLAAEVEDDLQQFARVGALVEGAGKLRWKGAGEQLDLFVPARDPWPLLLLWLSHYPNEGTSPFSRTGLDTRTASSLTRSSCVNSTVNPRPRRASIMCES